MNERIGFIGVGNMGGALARAVCRVTPGERVLLCNRTLDKAQALAAELGCGAAESARAAAECDYLFLGVKPQKMAGVLESLRPVLLARKTPPVLVSMAAGLTIHRICEMAGGAFPVIRIMPNTPAAVGQGMILYCCGQGVTEEARAFFCASLEKAGLLDQLEERLIDVGSAVCGCSPAFTDLYIEALADGGVACGLPRDKALRYAAAAVSGAAQLALQTGQHPGQLKDAVCSPGGSTIQGVRTLEQRGFRSAVMDAVIAAFEKNAALGKS